jgi:DtxR family Mn-dependent transcriptional regulator
MQTTRATEDCLKTIYGLATSGEPVTTGGLARRLGVSSPSVSAMIRRLESELLLQRPKGSQLRLTEPGRRAALRVVRRHRLLETFLASALDVPWDEVHAEAELLEHALSDRLEERIDIALGRPTRDPHGDPIPPRDGSHEEDWGQRLPDLAAGTRFLVERVSDRDSEALRYLGSRGVVPGAVLELQEREPFGGPQWVLVDGTRHALGAPLTRLVHGRVTA